jgi:hypothetical protein
VCARACTRFLWRILSHVPSLPFPPPLSCTPSTHSSVVTPFPWLCARSSTLASSSAAETARACQVPTPACATDAGRADRGHRWIRGTWWAPATRSGGCACAFLPSSCSHCAWARRRSISAAGAHHPRARSARGTPQSCAQARPISRWYARLSLGCRRTVPRCPRWGGHRCVGGRGDPQVQAKAIQVATQAQREAQNAILHQVSAERPPFLQTQTPTPLMHVTFKYILLFFNLFSPGSSGR